MSAICRTCGGEVPNHRPSVLDPNGIGHPGHKVLPFNDLHTMSGASREEVERLREGILALGKLKL